jgi:hypothetical protein
VVTEPGALEIYSLSSERTVALLTQHAIPFTEVAAHHGMSWLGQAAWITAVGAGF